MRWSSALSAIPGKIGTIPRDLLWTAVRFMFCVLVVWAFLTGTSLLSLRWPGVLAIATVFSLLASFELAKREAPPVWALASLLLIQAGVNGGYFLWRAVQPPEPSGPLIAAHDPSPPPGCDEKPQSGDLLMLFGPDQAVGKGKGPFMPFMVDDCVALKLVRRDGGLMIQAFGYAFSEDIAFHVMDNVYEPDIPLKMRAFRPDASTFVLLDRFDTEVLYVRYLNPGAVRIRGRFLCGNGPQAVVRDEAIFVGGVRINGVYIGQRPAKGHLCATIQSGAHGIAIAGSGS
jgi:hypothetical protein